MNNILQHLRDELTLELESIKKSLILLERSYNACKAIGIKNDYDVEELDDWESYTSRFARTSDIATQKLVNTLMLFEKIDGINAKQKAVFCVKQNLIEKEEHFFVLRLTRNFIVHEYSKEDINGIFEQVTQQYSILVAFVNAIIDYSNNNIL